MTTTTTNLHDRIEVNRFLAEVAKERQEALWVAIRDRDATGTPIPEKVSDNWEKGNAMLHKSATALAMNGPIGTVVETADGRLIVASIGSVGDPEIEVTLTGDGEPIALVRGRRGFHRPEDGEPGDNVRYEVYTIDGRVAHGYVGAASRKVTQTG